MHRESPTGRTTLAATSTRRRRRTSTPGIQAMSTRSRDHATCLLRAQRRCAPPNILTGADSASAITAARCLRSGCGRWARRRNRATVPAPGKAAAWCAIPTGIGSHLHIRTAGRPRWHSSAATHRTKGARGRTRPPLQASERFMLLLPVKYTLHIYNPMRYLTRTYSCGRDKHCAVLCRACWQLLHLLHCQHCHTNRPWQLRQPSCNLPPAVQVQHRPLSGSGPARGVGTGQRRGLVQLGVRAEEHDVR